MRGVLELTLQLETLWLRPNQADNFKMTKEKTKALEATINATHPDRLRKLLKELCKTSDTAFEFFTLKLLALVEDTRETESGKPGKGPLKRSHSSASKSSGVAKKYKFTSRYELCKQCHEEYDVTLNREDSCLWHLGKCSPCGWQHDSGGNLRNRGIDCFKVTKNQTRDCTTMICRRWNRPRPRLILILLPGHVVARRLMKRVAARLDFIRLPPNQSQSLSSQSK